MLKKFKHIGEASRHKSLKATKIIKRAKMKTTNLHSAENEAVLIGLMMTSQIVIIEDSNLEDSIIATYA